ncbi:helicase protein MOM1-like isoform X4 [Dioscorea cayenensis subsp. rotundata]|uniref:Helicase protein MOM1-like isoform X4 n=1 Tax=Dioscorea cayennensis subsp. rotundata TaxID=55577 RepID=A0AB40AP05_DIOCR|nr:helicase protein MOM1-like isoform X4 [Dioscorea cayenensis subsp. rotundata]
MLDGRKKLRHAQRNLHLLLKPELSSICGTLRLLVDVKCLAEKLLEYVMNNHLVVRDPETILWGSIYICTHASGCIGILLFGMAYLRSEQALAFICIYKYIRIAIFMMFRAFEHTQALGLPYF